MGTLIEAVIDEGSLFEIQPRWAKELIVGYARLEGRAIGIVASQPKHKGECCSRTGRQGRALSYGRCNAFNVAAAVPGGRARFQ